LGQQFLERGLQSRNMVYEFKLPDVGDDEEADLLKWMVTEGDGVREDDPVAEVETERAIIEIPSPVDGKVLEICADERERVSVGDTLAKFDTDEDGDDTRKEGVEILDNDGNAAVDVDAEGETGYTEHAEKETGIASQSTRLLAREVGVDIEEVEGSGADGRVVAQDILRAAKQRQDEREEKNGRGDKDTQPEPEKKRGAGPDFGGGEAPTVERETTEETSMFGGGDEREEDDVETADETEGNTVETREEKTTEGVEKTHTGNEATAEEKVPKDTGTTQQPEEPKTGQESAPEAETSAPLVTHHDTADAERIVDLSEQLADYVGAERARTSFLVKACGVALDDADFGVESDGETEEPRQENGTKLRVATSTDEGTRFATLEGSEQKGVSEIAAGIAEKAETELGTEDETEVILTLHTAATAGREGTTPIPDGPEEVAVAVGEVRSRPCVVEGDVVPRHTAPLSIAFDPNSVDGTEAVRFLKNLREYIEEPAGMLL
jgi:pyruvate dehydrogenase E2 component (dihydrolipoamide acetyltransferase)